MKESYEWRARVGFSCFGVLDSMVGFSGLRVFCSWSCLLRSSGFGVLEDCCRSKTGDVSTLEDLRLSRGVVSKLSVYCFLIRGVVSSVAIVRFGRVGVVSPPIGLFDFDTPIAKLGLCFFGRGGVLFTELCRKTGEVDCYYTFSDFLFKS